MVMESGTITDATQGNFDLSGTDAVTAARSGATSDLGAADGAVPGTGNSADLADAAHDLSQKKAKFSEEAHRRTSESGHHEPTSVEKKSHSKGSAFKQATDAALEKAMNGGMIFAAFSSLLAIMMGIVAPLFSSSFLSMVIPAMATGALWLGGNEFYRQYKKAREVEDSQLNQTINSAKHHLGLNKEKTNEKDHAPSALSDKEQEQAGLMSTVAAISMRAPDNEVAIDTTPEPTSKDSAIQHILEAGPRRHSATLLEKSQTGKTSWAEQALQREEAFSQQSFS